MVIQQIGAFKFVDENATTFWKDRESDICIRRGALDLFAATLANVVFALFGRFSADAEVFAVNQLFLLQLNFQKVETILCQSSLSYLKERFEEIQK